MGNSLRRQYGQVRLYVDEPSTLTYLPVLPMSPPDEPAADDPPADEPRSVGGELLRRHAAGDPAAAGELVVYCEDRLRAMVGQVYGQYPRLRHEIETSDVFQNLAADLLAALRKRTFATTNDFIRYAGRAVRNQLIDLTRKKGPESFPAHGSGESDPADRVPEATGGPSNLARWAEFHEAIEALPPDQRELFDLLYYLGLTQEAAAEFLGVPLRTLKAHWRAAKLALMDAYGDAPPS